MSENYSYNDYEYDDFEDEMEIDYNEILGSKIHKATMRDSLKKRREAKVKNYRV